MHPCHFLVFGVVVHHTTLHSSSLPNNQSDMQKKKWIEEKARCSPGGRAEADACATNPGSPGDVAAAQCRSGWLVPSRGPPVRTAPSSIALLFVNRPTASRVLARSRKSGFGEQEKVRKEQGRIPCK
jgi:hypothetical protein